MSTGPYCTIGNSQINFTVVTNSCSCHITDLHNAAVEVLCIAGNGQVYYTAVCNSKIAFQRASLIITVAVQVILIDANYGAITDNTALNHTIAQGNLSAVGCFNCILRCRIICFIFIVDIGHAQACYLTAISNNSILLRRNV